MSAHGPADRRAHDRQESRDDPDEREADGEWRTPGVLRTTVRRLREEPRLALPFALAGLLVALVDESRRRDPVPETTLPDLAETTLHVQFSIYPAGAAQTARRLGAFVDLRLPYLVYAVGLELLAVGAIAVAGFAVLRRALDAPSRIDALARYAAFVLGVEFALRLVGALFDGDASLTLLLGIVALAIGAYVVVRLFAVPAALVDGASFRRAFEAGDVATYGQRWSVLGVALAVGLAAWLLGTVPIVGGLLATAVVAPIHAVAIAVVYERGGSPAADRIEADHTGTEAHAGES